MSAEHIVNVEHPDKDGKQAQWWKCLRCGGEVLYTPKQSDSMWDWYFEHRECEG